MLQGQRHVVNGLELVPWKPLGSICHHHAAAMPYPVDLGLAIRLLGSGAIAYSNLPSWNDDSPAYSPERGRLVPHHPQGKWAQRQGMPWAWVPPVRPAMRSPDSV